LRFPRFLSKHPLSKLLWGASPPERRESFIALKKN
jgi:hypothetical protein